MRVFGFYHPYGIKKNVYMVFQTGNPFKHCQTIHKLHNCNAEAIEMLSLVGYSSYTAVFYANNKCSDHDKKFDDLLNCLKNDGNDVDVYRTNAQFRRWPYVTLSEANYNDTTYFEKLLNALME